MLDKWDWFKIFCTSSIYSVPVQKKLYQKKKLYYNIYTKLLTTFLESIFISVVYKEKQDNVDKYFALLCGNNLV